MYIKLENVFPKLILSSFFIFLKIISNSFAFMFTLDDTDIDIDNGNFFGLVFDLKSRGVG